MADIVIRELPGDVVSAIDSQAQRAHLSRSEYVRRVLIRERRGTDAAVSVVDLELVADRFADLNEAELTSDLVPGEAEEDQHGTAEADDVLVGQVTDAFAELGPRDGGELVDHQPARLA